MRIFIAGPKPWNHPIPYYIAPQRIARALIRAGHAVCNLDLYGDPYGTAGLPPNEPDIIFSTPWGPSIHATDDNYFDCFKMIMQWFKPDLAYLLGTQRFKREVSFVREKNIPIGFHQADPYWSKYPSRTDIKWHGMADYITCYDDKTEVLTKDGFKLFNLINFNDQIATLNEQGYIEYHTPKFIQCFYYEGKMIHFKGKNYNLLVTPDHRVFCKRVNHKKLGFISAENLLKKGRGLGNYELKRDAKWNGKDVDYFRVPPPIRKTKSFRPRDIGKVPIDLWLSFLGWYLAEGSVRERKDGAGRVQLAQLKEDGKNEIMSIIRKLCFSPYADKHGHIQFMSRQLHDYLKQFGKSKEKFIPQWIKELPPNRLEKILDTLLKGDGSKRGTTPYYTYYTTSKKLADDVQEIALKLGYGVSISFHKTILKNRSVDYPVCYYVYISKGQNTPQIVKKPKIIDYNGFVYDVTVPNHVIYIRRNGKSVWSGNCNEGHAWNYLRQHGLEGKVHLLSHAIDPELSPLLGAEKKYLCSTVMGGEDPPRMEDLTRFYYEVADLFPEQTFIGSGGLYRNIKWELSRNWERVPYLAASGPHRFNITKIFDYDCETFPQKQNPAVLCHRFIHRLYSQSYYGFVPWGWYLREGPQSTYNTRTFGTKIFEMGGSGAAMLSCRIHDIEEVVIDGKTGFILDTPEDARRAFQYAVDNPDEVKKMGEEAYRDIHKRHSWDVRYRDVLVPIFKDLGLM